MFILGWQGEVSSPERSLWCLTLKDPRGQGGLLWLQARGSRRFPMLFSCYQPSYLPTFYEYRVHDWKHSEACLTSPSLRQKVAKTAFWGWAGAWKRCQRGSWLWRAQTPLVQQDGFPSASECICHSDYKRAHYGAVTDSQGRERAAMKGPFPVLLVKTCCISLHCLNVFKLIWLSVCRVINELIGNLVGHLYFFLMFRYPMDLGGRNFLSTPQFL